MNKRSGCLLGVAALFIIVIVAICGGALWWISPRDYDVTGDPRHATDYVKGTQYILQADVFLTHDGKMRTPKDEGVSIEEFEKGPPPYALDIRGIVKKGTYLRFEKMEFHTNIENGNTHNPYMQILDGGFRGETVDVYWISGDWITLHKTTYSPDAPQIDPRYLVKK